MEDDNDDALTFLSLAAATANVVEFLTRTKQRAGKREAEQDESGEQQRDSCAPAAANARSVVSKD